MRRLIWYFTAFRCPIESTLGFNGLSNSSTMGCPPVRGDNPRALASGLSYVQVDKHGITILYHHHQCRHHEIFHAKVGKGGIMVRIQHTYVRFRDTSWI